MGEIPADMLKFTLDTHLPLTTKIINLSLENWCFPDDLKLSEVRPIFQKKKPKKKTNKQTKKKKKKNRNDDKDKQNYRSVNILFNASKVFKRIICTQVDVFMQDKLSNLLTGFRKKNIVHSIVWCTCLKFGKIY